MTVEQFDPKHPQPEGKQTTTLETPKNVLEEQASHVDHSQTKGSRIGFVSLGCLR
ncbi:hypothetical protein [Thalassotalea ganghwensis]